MTDAIQLESFDEGSYYQDPLGFFARLRESRPGEATGVYAHMLHADPPDHTRLRRLVQKAFAPRRAALRPRAEEIAAGLLDELAAAPGDVIDLLDRYARPLPIAVLCELLGIPAADREWIAVTVAAYDEHAEHQRVERDLAAYFTELIAASRAEPGDDLVSALVLACDNDSAADGLADRLEAALRDNPADAGLADDLERVRHELRSAFNDEVRGWPGE